MDATDKPRELSMVGQHKMPDETEYKNDVWESLDAEEKHKKYGWEDTGDDDFTDIVADVEIRIGTRSPPAR